MTPHDKALEAARKAQRDSKVQDIVSWPAPHLGGPSHWSFRGKEYPSWDAAKDAQQIECLREIVTAYRAALEGRESVELGARQILARLRGAEGVAERADHKVTAAACRDAAELIATLLTRIADREAEIVELKVRVRAAADDALQTLDAMLEDLGFLPNAPMRMKIKQALGVAP